MWFIKFGSSIMTLERVFKPLGECYLFCNIVRCVNIESWCSRQRVMIYFCEYRMLHDKAWLWKWVRCLLNIQCNNTLMICLNSVATHHCLSRCSVWIPVTYLLSIPSHTNALMSRSHVFLQCQGHDNSPMREIWSWDGLYRLYRAAD